MVMQHQRLRPRIQERGCRLLGIMVDLSDEQHARLIRCGAVEAVVEVMSFDISDAVTEKKFEARRKAACSALRELTYGTIDIHHREQVVIRAEREAGIFYLTEMIGKLSTKRGDHGVELRNVCETLKVVFSFDWTRPIAIGAGAIEEIAKMMKRRSHDVDIVRHCLEFLEQLLDTADQEDTGGVSPHRRAADEGVIGFVLDLLKGSPSLGCKGPDDAHTVPMTHKTSCMILTHLLDHDTEDYCKRVVRSHLKCSLGTAPEDIQSDIGHMVGVGSCQFFCDELEDKLRRCWNSRPGTPTNCL